MIFDLEERHCEGDDCKVTFKVLPASKQRRCHACLVKRGQADHGFRPSNGKKTPPVKPAR